MNSVLRNLVVWFVLGSLLIYVFNNIENTGAREQISYSQFKEEVLSDRIAKVAVSYTHLRAHETPEHLVCRLLLEKKK